MKNRPFPERVGFALAGWRSGWRRENSFRTQIGLAALAGAMVSGCTVSPGAERQVRSATLATVGLRFAPSKLDPSSVRVVKTKRCKLNRVDAQLLFDALGRASSQEVHQGPMRNGLFIAVTHRDGSRSFGMLPEVGPQASRVWRDGEAAKLLPRDSLLVSEIVERSGCAVA